MSAVETHPAQPLPAAIAAGGWRAFAICGAHQALFFGPFGERPSARRRREARAKKLCGQCPVELACRDAGRRDRESGIWGGETEEDRAHAGFPPRAVTRREVAQARDAGLHGDEQKAPRDPDNEAA